jgi:hypothetical protein
MEPWAVAVAGGQETKQLQGSVTWQVPKSAVDPFNSLPIDMPLRSKELFHYCECLTTDWDMTHSPPASV